MLTKDQAADIFTAFKKYSTADEVEVYFYGGKFGPHALCQQRHSSECCRRELRCLGPHCFRRAHRTRHDQQTGRRKPEACGAGFGEPGQGAAARSGFACRCRRREERGAANAMHGPLPSRHFAADCCHHSRGKSRRRRSRLLRLPSGTSSPRPESYSSSEAVEGIFNSRGLSDWHTQTSAKFPSPCWRDDSSGWQKANSPNVADLDAAALAEMAAQRRSVQPVHEKFRPGNTPSFSNPPPCSTLSASCSGISAGLAILDQRSFLNNRVGTKLFGENINIWDDVSHPLQSGSPFDGEGMRRQRVQLVENGVVKRLVYARATAEKMKHSEYADKVGPIDAHRTRLPASQRNGRDADRTSCSARRRDPQTVDQMIASTERGILVTRLWYIREVDPYEKILTGMTRDGTFLVEDGKVQHGRAQLPLQRKPAFTCCRTSKRWAPRFVQAVKNRSTWWCRR